MHIIYQQVRLSRSQSVEMYRSHTVTNYTLMNYTHLDWLTSIRDPILEVVNEICSSPMTISSSQRRKIMLKSVVFQNIPCPKTNDILLSSHSKYRERVQKPSTHLSAHPVRRRPQCIVFLRDFTVVNDPLQFLHHALVNVRLKPKTC